MKTRTAGGLAALVIGAAALLGHMSLNQENKTLSQRGQTVVVKTEWMQPLDFYVKQEYVLGNDPNKPNFYILLHQHRLNKEHGISDAQVRESILAATASQAAIYRILQHYNTHSGLQHISQERFLETDIIDQSTPNESVRHNPNFADRMKRVYDGNDTLLLQMFNHGIYGSWLYAISKPGFFITGYEDKETNESAHKALREAIRAKPALTESDVDKILGPFSWQTTQFAVKYSVEHAKSLHASGKIQSMDTGFVIGYKHIPSIAHMLPQLAEYNVRVISPIGLCQEGYTLGEKYFAPLSKKK